jgi:hypothetical protein
MKDRYLKTRVHGAVYESLHKRAAEAGQRLGTFVREVIERDAQAVSTEQALARIEAAIAAVSASSAPAPMPSRDHELHRQMHELRLIARELAMHMNAQILTRVASQIAVQASNTNPSRSA